MGERPGPSDPTLSTPPERQITIVGKEQAQALSRELLEASPEHVEEMMRLRASYDPQELLEEVKKGFRRVNEQVIGRQDVLAQTLFAFLTREHQLLYSRAGTAKTMLSAAVFGQFSEAQVFSIQFTKGTPEEALVGAVDIDKLKKGQIVHNTKGSVVDARLAFLDEIFDANDVALRSLLGILNERWFKKGGQQEKALLHTAIAATNYVRATDITEAVIDRFSFRAYIVPDDDPYTMLRIDQSYGRNNGQTEIPPQKIPFDYVDYLADLVEGKVPGKEIKVPYHVLFLKNEIILEYVRQMNEKRRTANKPELYISPRTIAKMRDVLIASALLNDRQAASIHDLGALRYMVCTIGSPDENQEETFEAAKDCVMSSMTKRELEIVEMLMNAHEAVEEMLAAKEAGGPVNLSLTQRLKRTFRVSSVSDLTFPVISEVVDKITPRTPQVALLKESLVDRMNAEAERYISGGKNDPYLF